ncbi:MAG: hypothetical protein ACRDNW_08985 [Trebonia sp.]
MSPDVGYWDSTVPAALRAKFSLVKGKYLPLGQVRPGTSFSVALGNRLRLICGLINIRIPLQGMGHATKGAVTVLHGVRVIPIEDSNDTADTVAYVTDTRKPEVVQSAWRLESTGEGETFTSISVGAPIDMAPPPPSQVIDPAKVGLPVVP